MLNKLTEYGNSDNYPFHMPGHKRQITDFQNPYKLDITEIEGFDNLHHPQGIIKEAQERAAALYGSKECYFLVNGSTCGLLAAISAATKKGDKVLVARNCHKAVYHGIYLRELDPVYVYPVPTSYGIQGHIDPSDVKEAFEKNPDIKMVIITSPTYEGVISDVKSIADYVHEQGAVLIVDEAHGAHLGLEEEDPEIFMCGMPENAIDLGADAVIMSIHKTLPSFTQTALLHLCSDRISKERVEQFLDIYETSSPSYVLMAGMDQCIKLLEQQKKELFQAYYKRLEQFKYQTDKLKHLHVLSIGDFEEEQAFHYDETKIVILSGAKSLTGSGLQKLLRTKFRLELEMAAGNYALAMTSIMDTEEGLSRLAQALNEIDSQISEEIPENFEISEENIYRKNEKKMDLWEALDAPKRKIPLEEAKGAVSGDYIYLYPPGIPLIVPGEIVSEKLISDLITCINSGLCVEGLKEQNQISIVDQF